MCLIPKEAPNGWRYAPKGYWWVGRENATLPEPALSQEKCLKTRRVPPPHLHDLLSKSRAVPVWLRRTLPEIECTSEIPGGGAVLGGFVSFSDQRAILSHDLPGLIGYFLATKINSL